MAEPHLLFERDGHVATVTLNRPEARNALSGEMLVRMHDAWIEIDEDPEIRVAIVTGAGGHFCAGADLKAMAAGHPDDEWTPRFDADPDLHWRALLRHFQPRKPLIAAVEGYAVAGGTEILQAMDLRVAGESAVFGVAEVRRGPLPARRQHGAPPAADPLHDRRRAAAHRPADAGRRGEGGRPHRPRRPRRRRRSTKARELADQIAANGPLAVQAVLRSLRESANLGEAEALANELELGWPVFGSNDAKEGPKAFAEKRDPHFTGT